MQLSKEIIPLNSTTISSPSPAILNLPEKVLQFGTGVLLRGLPDFYIDKANKQHVFNGRVVVIKSTDSGGTDAFTTQNGLYTHCIRGVAGKQMTEEYVLNASISRVLSAASQWEEIIKTAVDPAIEIVISNTTEVGIVLNKEDNVHAQPPASFPGKLLALLYKRYQHFNGDAAKGWIIIPTELITGNADKLLSILLELATLNQLEEAFINWLTSANQFCNSLVDRIVPGKLPKEQQQEMEKELGYTDELMIMSEVYSLWAIETTSATVKEKLSFATTDDTVIITNDISKYRELKLRLLNGTHTFTCGLAYLAGFNLVKNAMSDPYMSRHIKSLMMDEMVLCVCNENIQPAEATEYAHAVADRFSNPFIEHKWLSITLNYTQKMKMRNVPMLLRHYQMQTAPPQNMAIGFAAFLFFMKCKPGADGHYYGERNGESYLIQDEQAAYFHKVWTEQPIHNIANAVLQNEQLWDHDLSALPGFADAVQINLDEMIKHGAMGVFKEDHWLQ